ncbi:MAG: cysteinyl-tRNA synthetase [Bradyrhizobium sp.]|nr:cysteinyl-tRNA synthetase [Bradyrhizobium sp.]
MDLRLYDTLTKEKRPFAPLDAGNVRMYVCGPTVYDFAHIGNARPVIVFDVLFRLLRHLYGESHVTYVRNITDVDDKINDRAARDFPGLPLNEAIRKVTELTERQFHDDVDALGCLRPTVEPRATEHIAEMRTLIERLVQGGFAYVAEDHVLFSPQAMNAANSVLPRYGALANRSLDEMIAGARVDVAPYKRDATDFVLWKPAKSGEPSWQSPAGIKVQGRPGWHIECSAMAWKHLGEQFDIHGGGIDLVFPHHENELAQTCCVFHEARMANVWMHNGFLQVEGAKMSKSEGNFVTIRELLADWPGEVLRLNMLKTHYRSPMDWTVKGLEESAKTLDDWYGVIADVKAARASDAVIEALSDDLNTPQMIASLHGLRNRAASGGAGNRSEFAASLRVLGFVSETAAEWSSRKQQASGIDAKQVDSLISSRTAARARKDFKESDRIRDELAAMGIVIKDSKEGTTWEIAR